MSTTTTAAIRVPVILPHATRLRQYAADQRTRGLRLVTDGKTIYLTPLKKAGEFPVGEAA